MSGTRTRTITAGKATGRGATAVALAVLLASPSGAPPAQAEPFRVILHSGASIQVALDLPQKKLAATRALKGTELTGRVVENFFFQGCAVIRAEAPVKVTVADASAPLKGGVPGYFDLEMTEVTFADGRAHRLKDARTILVGEDRSDKGKMLKVFARKGGPAVLERDVPVALKLLLDPADKPPSPEPEEDGGDGEVPPPPKPTLVFVDAAACAAGGEAAG